MKFRWPQDQLDSFSDKRFLIAILNERLSDLNQYAPLARRLKAVRGKLDRDEKLTKDDGAGHIFS